MRLVQTDGKAYVFRLSRREKQLFRSVLRLYPLVPVAHHRVRRRIQTARDREAQDLLQEAMQAARQENRNRLSGLLESEQRFTQEDSGWRLSLEPADLEWLLQVLNDVRVGSWLILGCPDPDAGKEPKVNEQTAHYLVAMELAAEFEVELLEAVSGSPGPV